MPLSLEERLSLKNQALEMTAKQNNLIAMASKLPQEQALKVMNVAAYTGMDLKEATKYPHSVIESIISPTEYESLKNDALKTYEFLQDPVYMAAVRSKRNVMNLANLEQKSQYGTALLNGIKGIGRGVLGTVKMASDFLGKGSEENQSLMSPEEKMWHQEGGTNLFHAVSEAMDNAIKSEYLKGEEREQGFWLDVAETAPQIAAQIALAFVSSGTSMAFMGSQIAGSEYLKLRDEGVDTERAGIAAVLDAAVQTPLEKIGLDRLFKVVKTAGVKQKLAEISKTTLTEAMTEWIQQYPESIVEIWAKNPNFSADERSQQFYNDFWQTTKEGAYQGLVAAPFGFLGGAVKVSMQKQVAQANAEQVSSQIEDMRKSGIDPVILQAHAESINPNDKVYIDGQALAMFQSTDTELAEQLGLTDEQIQKAATTGQDIEVPASKYKVAMMERPEIEAKLKNDIKTEEEGLTVNQASSRNVKDIKKAQEEYLQEQNEMNIEKKKIYDNLREAGVGSEQSKNTLALLVSNAYRMSDNPAQYLRDNAPIFQRQLYLNQGGMKQPLNADVNPDEKVQPVDITNALPETVVTNKDLVSHIKNLVAEKTQLSTADNKAIMSILPKDVRHIVYSSNKNMAKHEKAARNNSLLSIKELIQNSVLIESIPNKKKDKKPSVSAYHRFYVPVKNNNKNYTVRIVAEEQNGSLQINPRDVNLYDVIIEKNRIAQQGMSNDLSLWGADNGSLSNISIRDMLSGVKDTDGNYYFQSEVTNTQFEKSLVSAGFKMINELTENEKSIATLGKMLGNEIRFFDGPAEFNGANRNGVSYINRNGDRGIEWAFWHESTHALKQSNPGLYNEVYEALKDTVTEKQISDYRKLLVNDILSDTEIIEEIIADEIGNIAIKPEALKTLQQIDGNVFERFIAAIKRMFTEIKYEVNKANTGLTEEQIQLIENHSKDIFKLVDDTKYYQNENNPRGAIQWNDEGRAIITLFEKADASTIVHELVGHFFTEELLIEGAKENAPAWMKKDRDTILKHSGIEDWNTATKEQQTEFHEKMAKWAETYLMEGKAPSMGLRSVFSKFKRWITRVYETLRQAKVDIPEDVRQVFDRMLASEEAIREMEIVEQYHKRLDDKVIKNLDDKFKNELDNKLLAAHDKAVDILRKKIMNFISADNKNQMEQERIKATGEITKIVSNDSLYRAIDIVEVDFKDSFKSAKKLAENYIEWETKENSNYNEETEFKFDMLAESLGFSSGSELAQKILNSPTKSEEIQNRVDEYMNKKFDDIYKSKEKIEEEARNAMYNDESAYYIALEQIILKSELEKITQKDSVFKETTEAREEVKKEEKQRKDEERELKRQKREQVKIDREAYLRLAIVLKDECKYLAQKEISTMPIKKAINPKSFISAERNAAVNAAKALMKKDYEMARRWKSVQLFNHAMVMESLATKRKYEGITKYLNKQKKSKKDTWKKEEHFNQAAALLEKFGFSRKDFEPQPGQESLGQWVSRMNELDDNVAIEDWLIYAYPQSVNDLTLDQCEDIVNALKNIKHIAKKESEVFQQEYKKVIEEGMSQLEKLEDKYQPGLGQDDKPESTRERYIALIENRDTLLAKLDGDTEGFFTKNFGLRTQLSGDREAQLNLQYAEKENEALHKWMPTKKELNQANKKVFYEDLGVSVDRFTLIEIALHTGTDSNRQRLFGSKPVGDDEFNNKQKLWVEGDAIQSEKNVMEFLEKNLTEKDWDFVQDLWDNMAWLWPLSQEVQKNTKGFIEKGLPLKSFAVRLKDGRIKEIKGGYTPLNRDTRGGSRPNSSTIRDDEPLSKQNSRMKTMHTETGYTKKRTNVKYPVNISRNNRFQNIQDTIHDICFRETVNDFRRIMNNEDFVKLLKRKIGRARYSAFRDYLFTVADPFSKPEVSAADKLLGDAASWLRRRTVNYSIVLNIGTAVQNIMNTPLYAKAIDGFGYADCFRGLGRGLLDAVNPSRYKYARAFVYSKSAFMKERASNPDFTLTDLQNYDRKEYEKKLTEWGTNLLVFTDNLTAIPMWNEAFEKRLNMGYSEREAIVFADNLIRKTLGSGRATDVAPLMRGGDLARSLTMFQGFFNTQYQQWSREYRIFLKEKDVIRLTSFVASKWLFVCLGNFFLMGGDPFDEDDEKDLLADILTYPTSLFGPAGQFVAGIVKGAFGFKDYGYRLTPAQSMMENTISTAKTAGKAIGGDKELTDVIEPAANLIAFRYGTPYQLNKLFFNGCDILFNDMDPEYKDIFKRRPKRER